MAEQTDQQKAEAAKAAAAAEAEKQQKAEAAKAASGKIVLTHVMHDTEGKLLPVGTVLDASIAWVKRCVLPFDLWEPKAVYDAKQRVATAVAEAEAAGKEAIAKAKRGEE